MKVLVTGSAGYLGKVILNHLSIRGYETVGLDINSPGANDRVADRFYLCDVTDKDRLMEIFSGELPDAVVHLASTFHRVRDRKQEYAIDIGGSRNLLEAARITPSVRKFIYSSSAAIYGASRREKMWLDETDPVKPGSYRYGINKKVTEEMMFSGNGSNGLQVVSLRLCTVVGPLYSRPRSAVSILLRLPVLPSSFRRTRLQFMHEEDFAEITGRVIDENVDGLFNVAPGSCTVVGDVVPAGRFRHFPCRLLLPVMWLLWHLRLCNLQPAGFGYCLYPVVMDSTKLISRFDYHFRYSSSEAFLAVQARNMIPAGARF
jgi:nucleoside-diphosphate-sugar epimerase